MADTEDRTPRIGLFLYEEWYQKTNKATIAELTFTLAQILITLREGIKVAPDERVLAFLQDLELKWPSLVNREEFGG